MVEAFRTDYGVRAEGATRVVEWLRSGGAGGDLYILLAKALEEGEERGWSVESTHIPGSANAFVIWRK